MDNRINVNQFLGTYMCVAAMHSIPPELAAASAKASLAAIANKTEMIQFTAPQSQMESGVVTGPMYAANGSLHVQGMSGAAAPAGTCSWTRQGMSGPMQALPLANNSEASYGNAQSQAPVLPPQMQQPPLRSPVEPNETHGGSKRAVPAAKPPPTAEPKAAMESESPQSELNATLRMLEFDTFLAGVYQKQRSQVLGLEEIRAGSGSRNKFGSEGAYKKLQEDLQKSPIVFPYRNGPELRYVLVDPVPGAPRGYTPHFLEKLKKKRLHDLSQSRRR